MIASLLASPLVRNTMIVLGLIAVILLALAGFRRKAEQTGRLIEREQTRAKVEKVKKRMEAVPRPSDDDVSSKLRNHRF